MYSRELLKGSLQTIVLQLLAENGRMYGYQITQRVKELSAGEILLTEGALYPTLHKLEADGLVLTETVSIGKYALTPQGADTTVARVQEFLAFVNTMKVILAGTAALSIALLTTGYHALRAARINPVNALRYE